MRYKKFSILICVAVLLLSNLVYFSSALATTDASTETDANVELVEEEVNIAEEEIASDEESKKVPEDAITEEEPAAESIEEVASEAETENLEEVEVLEEEIEMSSMDLQSSEVAVAAETNIENELFDFEAFIKETDIISGTAPFDSNDEPGNDSGDKNFIVRTFDTVSYPIKITINPKKADKLKNIKIKISGTLENGIVDGRVNANFAIGGYENLETGEVGFEQIYTIEQTGNSVMIPIAMNVQGARNNIQLKPNLKVQVISVDGEDLTDEDITMIFDNLPSSKTSAKANIRAYMTTGLTGQGMAFLPYSAIDEETEELSNIMPFAVAFGVKRLEGKNDIRGATFPDGEIKYDIDLSGHVYWDGGELKGKSVPLNFNEQDTPLAIFDHQPINSDTKKTGSANTLSEGKTYDFVYAHRYNTARSKLDNFAQSTIEKEAFRSVWDSGKWNVANEKISSSKVTYDGSTNDYVIGSTFPEHRSDGYRGTQLYGVHDKVFATNSYLMKVPNEYIIGGKNNEGGFGNNVYYKATVNILSYEDADGNVHSQDGSTSLTFDERNNPVGSYSVNNTFISYPSGQGLGTVRIGDSAVSHGDPSVIIGTDVMYRGYVLGRIISYGGYDLVYRWNTDSFELTEDYAIEAEKRLLSFGYHNQNAELVKNDTENQKILFGVPKFSDNSFENFTSKGKDDYTWYDSYEKAVGKGKIGAIKNEIKTAVGAKATASASFPLHVKTEKIGSLTSKNTPNIIVTNAYAFLDKNRERMIDISAGRTYRNPTLYDEEGNLETLQGPVGSSINFETLGIMNAETSTDISSDKNSYYNSEKVEWRVKNSVILSKTGPPDSFDGSVQVKQILPKGLDYTIGSGKIGDQKKEPLITKNEDGTTTLIWEYLVSEKNLKLGDIVFSTDINPFALSSGVQSSLTVDSIISSKLDVRREHLRTSSKTINILKVGMVGIYETIEPEYGGKNSSYTINLKPYTTIEEEYEVKGVTVLPFNKDKLGSSFTGTSKLSDIKISGGKPVSIYLNNSVIETDKPNKVDITSDGWYKYTGSEQNISQAATLLFHVEGVLENHDNVNIAVTLETNNNKFGDLYFNETTINSATDYKLSPVSNKVKYAIRAASELSLERIQIYTANFEKGLPVKVRVKKEVISAEALEEKGKMVLYEKESELKIFEKEFTVGQLERENTLLIPTEFLVKDSNKSYEVRIEGVNEDLIHVLEDAAVLDTLGYTASQKKLNLHVTEASELEYKGVVMTEREVGKDMVTFYETLTIPLKKIDPVKSGYGMEMNMELNYKNELGLGNVEPFQTEVLLDSEIVDGIHETVDGKVTLNMLSEVRVEGNTLIQQLKLPKAYVEAKTGSIFTEEQKEDNIEEIQYELLDGGNKVYVPIWIEELGAYDMSFKSIDAIGVNEAEFNIADTIEVYAYMYGYIGSETIEDDEILIEPVDLTNPFPQGLPNGWDSQDVDWFNSN